MAATSASEPATVDLAILVSYLDEYLAVDQISDHCPNGLQVEGKASVTRVVTGVSACAELFRTARRAGADAVLVHHGLFWRGTPRTLTGIQYRRVAELIHGDLSLLAYHLPLDRHLEVGNNAVAARQLGLVDPQPFGEMDGLAIGVAGRFEAALRRSTVIERLRELYGRQPLDFSFGPEQITKVGIVSGSGSRFLEAAAGDGVDLFVTGEAEEWTMNLAREFEINFVAAGHYATETLGVQALGRHLQDKFGVGVDFVDIPNPV